MLKRGYSITTKDKGAITIKDAGTLAPGETVKTRLNKGAFLSRVESIEGGDQDAGS